MKLFIWRNFFCDYTCGIAFALAHNVDEARQAIIEDCYGERRYADGRWSAIDETDLGEDYEVYNSPYGTHVGGGG